MLVETIAGQMCFTYAAGSKRLLVTGEQALFEGQGERHILSLEDGVWSCDCAAYRAFQDLPGGGWCQHVVALTHMLNTQTVLPPASLPGMQGFQGAT